MRESFREELKRLAGDGVRFEEPLANHTSLGVGGPALAMVYPESPEQLGAILAFLNGADIPCLPVGNGTNLLVRDGGYRGVVICMKRMAGIRIYPVRGNEALLRAEAGASLAEVVSRSAAAGLAGLEFCAGIPGSVGGAVTMNAGAYGREIKDVLSGLIMMDRTGKSSAWPCDRLQFHYRRFEPPIADGLITTAVFRLAPGDPEAINGRIKEIKDLRRRKHPLEHRSAGSVFKNPAGQPAGRIIEETGLKGMWSGGAQVSEKHGNFIVNRGEATAKDILTLIETIQERVERERHIRLEMEVVVVGEDS
ncbi:MAG: UDP-N-acetylmuramate dehydrogenase [Pseudomonadota bacterium]|nr:UDP-N-acetylmuramate dehydrogenase [Pseudomonadota bacterium]